MNLIRAYFKKLLRGGVEGYVDGIDQDHVTGWAWNPRAPLESLEVEVVAKGRVLGRALADVYRNDLEAAGVGDGRHAFAVALPVDVDPSSVTVRVASTRRRLPWLMDRQKPGAAAESSDGSDQKSFDVSAEKINADNVIVDATGNGMELREERYSEVGAAAARVESDQFEQSPIDGDRREGLEEHELNDIVMADLADIITSRNRKNIEILKANLGWDDRVYRSTKSELSSVSAQSPETKQLAHFLEKGIQERRQFSRNVSFAKQYFFDPSIYSGAYLLIPGWSEIPLSDPKVIVQGTANSFGILPAKHLNFWRDDVAKHLGVSLRRARHGFLLLLQLPPEFAGGKLNLIIRDGKQMLVGSISPRRVELEELLQYTFHLLQSGLSYEEMVRTFDEHYEYLEFLRRPLRRIFTKAPAEFWYENADAAMSVDLTVCAVLLGSSVLLKPFVASLMEHRPANACWELLLLANSGLEVDNLKLAAEWCSTVYGIDVTVFCHENNLGFGGGMNFLVSRARGRITMMSNVDLRFSRFDASEISRETVGCNAIVAAYQFNPWGSLQHEGLVHDRRSVLVNGKVIELVDTRLLGRNTYPATLVRKEVDYFGAACLVGDTEKLRALGPFSTDYFYAYHEDCDLARRARADGLTCALSPALQVVHYESSAASAAAAMPLRGINAANLVTFMRTDAATGKDKT